MTSTRRETHLEPGVEGEGGIEQTERMRKVEFLADLEIIAVADGERRGAPLPYSVEGENRRLFERRGDRRPMPRATDDAR